MSDDARIEGDTVEQRDRDWLANVYRGDKERDLTVRAILAGMLFGGLMSLSNLYVGLKTGWGLGVDIAAVIVIFTVFKALRGIGLVRSEFGIMENTMMMSVAVAASWISSAGLVSAVPALSMLQPDYELKWWKLTLFIGVILYLGLFMAIPLKRQMIQVERLRFPGNIPTGETLKVLYAHGSEAIKKASALGISAALGMIVAFLRDGLSWLPDEPTVPGQFMGIPLRLKGVTFNKLTLTLQPSLIFVSIGALFGMKVGMSMLLGVIVNYGILAPWMIDVKEIKHDPPQIVASAAPQFPLVIEPGQSFTVKVEEADSRPELPTPQELKDRPELASTVETRYFTYTWKKPATYHSLADLEKDLNAATLQDGSPNPLHEAIAVGEAEKENPSGEEKLTITVVLKKVSSIFSHTKPPSIDVLTLKAPADKFWEARLSLPPDRLRREETLAALGFKVSSDIEKLKVELAATNEKLTLAQEQLTTADAAKRAADTEAAKAEAEIVKRHDEKARATAEQALVQAELVRNKAEIARTKLKRAKTAKTEAEKALEEAEKGQASATAKVGSFRNINRWSVWPGATVLVVAGLLALAFQWRSLGRTFASIFAGIGGQRAAGPVDQIEIPIGWFAVGFPVAGVLAALLLIWVFQIQWWMGLVAVVMTFFLAAVVARAGAETSINPIGAMGKVTQLTFGALAPGNITANLMTAGVTAGAACSCGDTVGNLKVGHMVGANPRKQFISQFFGVFAGAILAVPAYFILVPDANALGGDKFPAPSALAWKAVAEMLSKGLHAIPMSARWAMAVAFVLGTLIVVIDNLFPRLKPYTPSPTALGIALTMPGSQGLAMFLGALIAWVLEKRAAKWNAMYMIPVASGCIAGESIMGVIIAVWIAVRSALGLA